MVAVESKDSLARVFSWCARVVMVGEGAQDSLVLECGFLAIVQPLPLCHVLILRVILQIRVDSEVVRAGHLCLRRKSLVELLRRVWLCLSLGGECLGRGARCAEN